MHIVADISAHGLGHLSQTAPVLDELYRLQPGSRLTVRCDHPLEAVSRRIHVPFLHQRKAMDFGMCMHSAIDVDAPASMQAYQREHADWEEKVATEAKQLQALDADLLIGNVPYLSMAAAGVSGVRSAMICSLNWADILEPYCGEDAGMAVVVQQIRDAYATADCCILTTPAMPMDWLPRRCSVPPVVGIGRDRRRRILHTAAADPDSRLVVVNFGGMSDPLTSIGQWPAATGIVWIVPDGMQTGDQRAVSLSSIDMPFLDVLCSCDALLTKPGYGSITEAVCHGIPVVYVPRGDWPEEAGMLDWLHANGRAKAVSREQLERGEVIEALESLWSMPVPVRPPCDGARQAAELVLDLLQREP